MKKKNKNGELSAEETSKNELNTQNAENDIFDSDEFDMVFSGDQATDATRKKKRSSLSSIFNIRNLLLLVCIVVFAGCAVILFGRWFDYQRTDEIYLSLSEDMF